MRAICWVLWSIWMLASPAAQALQLPIYEGNVVLAPGQDERSDAALREALTQVLVKVSGDRTVADDPGLAAALAGARGLAIDVARRTAVAGDVNAHLAINFDPGRVHELLAALGRPVWQSDRPVLLVWLVIDDGVQKRIASAAQVEALADMTAQAQRRGLPLLLPRMDSVDQNRINPVTLWVAPPQTVLAAGQRYGVETMLVIRLTRGTPWRARYTLIDGRTYEEWQHGDTQSSALLVAAIDGAVDRLARRYAVEPEGSSIGTVEWWVDGVDSAADYASVIGYFERMEFVRSLQPLRAESGRLLLRLDLGVGRRRLQQLLAIDGRMRLEADVAAGPAAQLHLVQ